MLYKVIPPKSQSFVCSETGIDYKCGGRIEKIVSSKKYKKALKAVKKSVIRKEIADSKRPLKWTGRYIYQNGIATREMK